MESKMCPNCKAVFDSSDFVTSKGELVCSFQCILGRENGYEITKLAEIGAYWAKFFEELEIVQRDRFLRGLCTDDDFPPKWPKMISEFYHNRPGYLLELAEYMLGRGLSLKQLKAHSEDILDAFTHRLTNELDVDWKQALDTIQNRINDHRQQKF